MKDMLKIAKYFTDAFPDETLTILEFMHYRDEESLEILDAHKKMLLQIMQDSPPGKRADLLMMIPKSRVKLDEKNLEQAAFILKQLDLKDGELLAFILDNKYLMDLERAKLLQVKDVIKEYHLVSEKTTASSIERTIEALLKMPKQLWKERIELALTICDADQADHILSNISENLSTYQLISRYRLLLPYNNYTDLLKALAPLTDADLQMVAPLLNKLKDKDRGLFVVRVINPEILDDIKRAPEKIKVIVDMVSKESKPLTLKQLIDYVTHLYLDAL